VECVEAAECTGCYGSLRRDLFCGE
jgi:hypothetical protein